MIWNGFRSYLAACRQVEQDSALPFLRAVWFAGSFISDKLNPEDIDITPIINGASVEALKGHPGAGKVKQLFTERQHAVDSFHVEPFVVQWVPLASTLFPDTLSDQAQSYLRQRGGVDDWWQRLRATPGIKAKPTAAEATPRRGYLEVIVNV